MFSNYHNYKVSLPLISHLSCVTILYPPRQGAKDSVSILGYIIVNKKDFIKLLTDRRNIQQDDTFNEEIISACPSKISFGTWEDIDVVNDDRELLGDLYKYKKSLKDSYDNNIDGYKDLIDSITPSEDNYIIINGSSLFKYLFKYYSLHCVTTKHGFIIKGNINRDAVFNHLELSFHSVGKDNYKETHKEDIEMEIVEGLKGRLFRRESWGWKDSILR